MEEEFELLPPPPKKSAESPVVSGELLPPPPKKKDQLSVDSEVGSTESVSPTATGTKPEPAPPTQADIDKLQKELGKVNPLKRIELYTSSLNSVNERFARNAQLINAAKQAGDEAEVARLAPLIREDVQKAQYFKKAIAGQKQLAQLKEPNTVANTLGIGLESAAGLLMSGPKAFDEATDILLAEGLEKLGLGGKKMLENVNKAKEQMAEKGFDPMVASNQLAKVGVELLKESKTRSQEKRVNLPYQGSGWEAIKNGDISTAAEYGSKAFLESLPTSVTFLNPYTAAASMSGMVGEEMTEAEEEGRDVNSEVVLAGTIKAGLELATERMFGAGKATKELIESLGKEGAEQAMRAATEEMVKTSLKKKLGQAYVEEVAGEVANQIGSNVVDKYLLDKDVDLTEGVGEAGWTALFGAGIQGTAPVVLKHNIDTKRIAQANELSTQSAQMMQDAENEPDPGVRETIEAKAEQLKSDADAIIVEQNEVGDNASPETVQAITQTNERMAAIDQTLSGPITEATRSLLEEERGNLEKEQAKLIKQATKEAKENIDAVEAKSISGKEATETSVLDVDKTQRTETPAVEETETVVPESVSEQKGRKQKQLDIILIENPAPNDVNTWVRTVDDIKTAQEAFESAKTDGEMYPDFTVDDMRNALSSGEVVVYSSQPIKNGVFVSPSKMNAQEYAGGNGGKIYSEKVSINDVAWIDEGEGQYAKVEPMSTKTEGGLQPEGESKLKSEIEEEIEGLENKLEAAKTDAKKREVIDKLDELDGKNTGVSHAETEKLREEFGIPEYEKSVRKQAQVESEADKKIKAGYNINTLITKLEKGTLPTDVEHEILKTYIANVSAKVEKNPTPENIAEAKRVIEASDRIGSEVGRSLAARRGLKPREDSLMDYFMQDIEANEGAPLTEAQREQTQKEYEEIKSAKEALEKKLDELQKEHFRVLAEKEIASARGRKKSGEKKTHAQYVSERKAISKDIKEKLKKARTQANAAIIPYLNELILISPDVAKMVRSYVEEGVTNLGEIVDGIHDVLKEEIPEITTQDVTALIAGDYNPKPKTKSEISAQLKDVRDEAKLISRYEALQSGEEPQTETKKIERNKEIESLKKQIKEHDLTKLSAYKKRVEGQISKLEEELKQPVIEERPAPAELKLDKEAIELKDKYIKLKQERELRIIKQQYANRSKSEKIREKILDVANIPRTLMSSMDFSAPLRQALVATVSHPQVAGKAFIEMFQQAVSQKRFDRWFNDVKEDPRYARAEASGLYIADPHDPRLSAKEEAFMNNLAEKIPGIGILIKGSERAYVSYLNKMRWDLFNNMADEIEKSGKTFQNSPRTFQGLADFLNNATGRGKMPFRELEDAAPLLNSILFSPRLVMSRINFLNPFYYAKLPKEVRIQALKDIGILIGIGMSIMALASANGADVEDDPRSTDFGKIKVGNTRWDIWGGYQQYIRVLAQLITGQTKSAMTGKMSTLSGAGPFGRTHADVMGKFVRGKLAPVPSTILDFAIGRDITGEKVTVESAAEKHLLPLLYSDVKEAYKSQGPQAFGTALIPAMFGVGVSTYEPRHDKYKK